jgi:molybdopterin converting factor small subunit
MVRILIPTPLRPYVGEQDIVAVEGDTVGEALEALTRGHAELRHHLYNSEGKLRSFVNVYVNDQDIRHLGRESTKISEHDVVSIVPSVAGGSFF